jgi:UDP-N-acetylmuramate--alanine ligase
MSATNTSLRESTYVSRFYGKRVHFIGIGGCGMSGLARILADAGAIVTGSEPNLSNTTMQLARHGIKITREQHGEQLSPEVDLVVRTAAVKDDNAEFLCATALKLPHMKYAQLLGQIMRERLAVAVSGTHGKTTTTAMIAYILTHAQQDPSWVVGGNVPQLGGSSASGAGKAFVVEACEFDRSFHNLFPTVALITNIDTDHLDCYKNLDEIIASFRHFLSLLPEDGLIICNGEDENVARAVAGLACGVHTVAVESPATWSVHPTGKVRGCHTGQLIYGGQLVAEIALSVAGEHNLFNAAMAIAACSSCGLSPAEAARCLAGFTGVDRRMTNRGTFRGAHIIDDYGHHPTEIKATLAAIRERYDPKRLFCVFQPHQYSRTRLLLDEFATCFSDADVVILPEIYKCRDTPEDVESVNSNMLARRIIASGVDARHIPEFGDILAHLKVNLIAGDLVVTMGAGNVCEIGKQLADLKA